jgi:hypothetical protein
LASRATLHAFAFAKNAVLQINETISGAALIAQGFIKDLAVPDIIVRPNLGTSYSTGTSKTVEHGSLNDDDRKGGLYCQQPNFEEDPDYLTSQHETSRTNDPEGVGSESKCIEGS